MKFNADATRPISQLGPKQEGRKVFNYGTVHRKEKIQHTFRRKRLKK
jgi:hypothetical protein